MQREVVRLQVRWRGFKGGLKAWNGRLQRSLLDRQGSAVELTVYIAIVYASKKLSSPNSLAPALSAGRRVLRLPAVR